MVIGGLRVGELEKWRIGDWRLETREFARCSRRQTKLMRAPAESTPSSARGWRRGLCVRAGGGVRNLSPFRLGSRMRLPASCTTRRGDSRGSSQCRMSGRQPQGKYSTNFLIFLRRKGASHHANEPSLLGWMNRLVRIYPHLQSATHCSPIVKNFSARLRQFSLRKNPRRR